MFMLQKYTFFNHSPSHENAETFKSKAQRLYQEIVSKSFLHLNILDYSFTSDEAMQELGLDEDLVNELVEDYVAQIIKALLQFEDELKKVQEIKEKGLIPDFTTFTELVHKNLGVARNLRIKDAQLILSEMMHSRDLVYLGSCLDALEASAIRLKPLRAYKTYKLIEVKNSF